MPLYGLQADKPQLASLLFLSTLFVGCGSSPSASNGTPPVTGASTPNLSVAAASPSVTTLQSLAVSIAASGSSAAATPAGTVILSSGNYASFPATLSNGQATITVPAGVLAAGSDTLTAAFASSNTQTFTNTSATAAVTVIPSNTTPTVTTTSATYTTAGAPFRAILDPAGDILVSETDTATHTQSGVEVFHQPTPGTLQSGCINLLRTSFQQEQVGVFGLNLFNKGANVATAIDNEGVLFFTTSAFANCTAQGTQVSQGTSASGQGSFDVTVTADGKFAFVANEYGVAAGATTSGNIGVVSLQYDTSGNVTGGTLLGQIATGGNAIAGLLLSPDGTRLYVTSEIDQSNNQIGSGNPVLARTGCLQAAGGKPQVNGLLTVIDVAKAEATPSPSAILTTVDAGCSPVRMVETTTQGILWVAARGDNRVLAFNPGMLEMNPANALLGYADTGGVAPVGITLFSNQQLLAVANSNRFATTSQPGNATILQAAVPASAGVVQTIATGVFPREITVGSDDATLYLTNYLSNTLQIIQTATH